MRRVKHLACYVVLVLGLIAGQLATIPIPVGATNYNQDPGLNSGNATVDRSTVPGQTILKYRTTGTSSFTAPSGVTSARVLVVAGGGSGGNNHGGGGGAGELYQNAAVAVTPGSPVTVAVGAGGAAQTINGNPGNDGGDSRFGSVSVNGGGGGGSRDGGVATGPGRSGGSGGGGAGNTSEVDSRPGGASVKIGGGLGNAGGTGDASIYLQAGTGGGGGGAGGAGANASPSHGGNGGAGILNDITGTAVGYAGGGGGNGWATYSIPPGSASAGGASGSVGTGNDLGVAASANTGGGGGGGGPAFGDGGAGGSGVVIIRFTTVKYGVEMQVADNITSEAGDTGLLKFRLSFQPTAPVTLPLSSSNTGEGTVLASITIQPSDWNNFDANTVTVTGVNDSPAVADGAVQYTVVTGDVSSSDPNYDSLVGTDVDDATMFNLNDDPPGINAFVSGSNTTSENGDCATVRFELLSQPTAAVTVPLSVSDTSEGTLHGVTQITINPANWNQPQSNEVTVCGVDDGVTDGDILYNLVLGDPTSVDAGYDALTAAEMPQIALINIGGDSDGITSAVEDAAPHDGDANDDGVPDSTQSNVASFVNPLTGKYVALAVDDSCQITTVATATGASEPAADADYDYPEGLMSFTIDCGTPGFIATVRQYYYGATGSYVVRKFNPNTNTYATIDSADAQQMTIGGEVLALATYQVTDGGTLDTDGAANSTIVDPAGLAVRLAARTAPGSTGGGTLTNTGLNTLLASGLAGGLIIAALLTNIRYRKFLRR